MGMAASQARFLGLTARKTNVEYEGQQINQQRTTLANQSANYYNQLLGMSVPVPPSVADYTKTVYSFKDGALTNTLTNIQATANGEYKISYLRKYTDDFSIVSYNTHRLAELSQGYISETTYNKFLTGTNGGCYTSAIQNYDAGHYAHTFAHMLQPGNYTTSDGKPLTIYPPGSATGLNSRWWTTPSAGSSGDIKLMDEISAELVGTPMVQKIVDLLYEFMCECYPGQEIDATKVLTEGTRGKGASAERKNELAQRAQELVTQLKYSPGEYWIGNDKLRELGKIPDSITDANGNIIEYLGNDPYLKSLSIENLNKLLLEEQRYIAELQKKFGENVNWQVRYVKNTSSNTWEPFFYNTKDLENALFDEDTSLQLTHIPCYTIGAKEVINELKNQTAKFEQDSTGRYTSITLYDENGNKTTYALITETVTDQAKYDDAMNQYEYDKYLYDKAIQEINAKIEITQLQDKNLELRLKQLDTEQNAIQTEMDAVSKVIEKNTESTFKTFG